MSSTCRIYIRNIVGAYFVGEFVDGAIILTTTKEKNIKNIEINLVGRVSITWQGKVGIFFKRKTKELYTRKTLINKTTVARFDGVLPPGTYDYGFRFETKDITLTSYEGSLGHIRYEVCLVINKTDGTSNIFSQPVTIIKHFDLNGDPKYAVSPTESISNKLEYAALNIFYINKRVHFTFQTKYLAYVPGQIIVFSIQIHNLENTTSDITSCRIDLIKEVKYSSALPVVEKNCIKTTIASKRHLENERYGYYIPGEIRIPPTCPTTSQHSPIYVKYYLEPHVTLSQCVFELRSTHEIVVGTVPLEESVPRQRTPLFPSAVRRKPYTFKPDTECTPFIDMNIDPTNRVEYCPLYPVRNLVVE